MAHYDHPACSYHSWFWDLAYPFASLLTSPSYLSGVITIICAARVQAVTYTVGSTRISILSVSINCQMLLRQNTKLILYLYRNVSTCKTEIYLSPSPDSPGLWEDVCHVLFGKSCQCATVHVNLQFLVCKTLHSQNSIHESGEGTFPRTERPMWGRSRICTDSCHFQEWRKRWCCWHSRFIVSGEMHRTQCTTSIRSSTTAMLRWSAHLVPSPKSISDSVTRKIA